MPNALRSLDAEGVSCLPFFFYEAITTTWATFAQGTGLDSEGAKSSHFMDPSNTTDRVSQGQFEEVLTTKKLR